jgi:hypothetical protein
MILLRRIVPLRGQISSETHPTKKLAEVHGNRTHLPPSSDGTPDLKSGGPTSEPGTSASLNVAYARTPVNRGELHIIPENPGLKISIFKLDRKGETFLE